VVASSNPPAVFRVPLNELLTPEAATGQIQFEYHFAPAGVVEFVKGWEATVRGHWNLICSYWMGSATSRQSGLKLANGHNSHVLGGTLNSIMHHPELFLLGIAPGTGCMIQVSRRRTRNAPSPEQC
jgi:hypothetical protein